MQLALNEIILVALLTYYTFRVIPVISSYRCLETYIEEQIYNFPDMYCGYTWKGITKLKQGRKFCALEIYQDGLRLRPQDFRLRNNIAVVLGELGFLEEAIANYQMVVDGLCYLPEGKEEEFKEGARQAIAKIRAHSDKCDIERQNAIIDMAKQIKNRSKDARIQA